MTRRAARERALELLYEAEIKELAAGDLLAQLPLEPDPFAVELVVGVEDHRARLDELISDVAVGWRLERMPAVDRALLRLGVFELAECPETPTAVVISEAVELAKRFSTEESGRFVNGMLSRLARDLRGG